MHKKSITLAVTTVLVLVMVGCEEEGLVFQNPTHGTSYVEYEDAGTSSYFPYELGRVWEYEGVLEGSIDYPDDFTIDDTTWIDSTWTLSEVIDETQLTGSNPLVVWVIENTTTTNNMEPIINYSYIHITSDSAYGFENLGDSDPWFVMPAEPKLGDAWDIVNWINDTTTSTTHYEVIEDDAEANGFSDCLKIDITFENAAEYDEFEHLMYWAKGEGNVMWTLYTCRIYPVGDSVVVSTYETEYKLVTQSGILE